MYVSAPLRLCFVAYERFRRELQSHTPSSHCVCLWATPLHTGYMFVTCARVRREPQNYTRSSRHLSVRTQAYGLFLCTMRAFNENRKRHTRSSQCVLAQQAYGASRAALIDPKCAQADVKAGQPWASSDTVYFAVVDGEGNACSFIVCGSFCVFCYARDQTQGGPLSRANFFLWECDAECATYLSPANNNTAIQLHGVRERHCPQGMWLHAPEPRPQLLLGPAAPQLLSARYGFAHAL